MRASCTLGWTFDSWGDLAAFVEKLQPAPVAEPLPPPEPAAKPEAYDAADNSKRSFDVAIDALHDRLEASKVELAPGVVLYNEDALFVLPTLWGIDAVITDPPYSSGGQFRGDRAQKTSVKYVNTDSRQTCRAEFSGDNRDQRAFLAWASLWFSDLFRASKAGAVCCVFTDWRQLPTMTDAVQCGGWVWRNLVTWWKPGIRMQRGRFSSSAEYVVYASSGTPAEGEASPQNVLSMSPVRGIDKKHIAEKPVELLKTLIGVTPRGSTVLDPFMGSGTTGVACIQTGRKFIGIERDPESFATAVKRIKAELDAKDHG